MLLSRNLQIKIRKIKLKEDIYLKKSFFRFRDIKLAKGLKSPKIQYFPINCIIKTYNKNGEIFRGGFLISFENQIFVNSQRSYKNI